jgi:hypothetical protein
MSLHVLQKQKIEGKYRTVYNLTKIPNQGGSSHQSAFEVRTNFSSYLIVCLDLWLGRTKECNFRLIYNIKLRWMLF